MFRPRQSRSLDQSVLKSKIQAFIVTLEQSDKHVIQKLKSIECEQYILPWQPVDVDNFPDTSTMIYVNHLLRVQRFPHQIL